MSSFEKKREIVILLKLFLNSTPYGYVAPKKIFPIPISNREKVELTNPPPVPPFNETSITVVV